jgi:hypothetical protein
MLLGRQFCLYLITRPCDPGGKVSFVHFVIEFVSDFVVKRTQTLLRCVHLVVIWFVFHVLQLLQIKLTQ